MAGIGIIDKTVTEKVSGKAEIKNSRTYVITKLEGIDAETLLKIKKKSLEYRGAALGTGCAT